MNRVGLCVAFISRRLSAPSRRLTDPSRICGSFSLFFFQAEDGIRDTSVTGVQTCALPISAEAHPVLATRVKRAHKLRGQKLIVSDLRKHEMAERADLFIHPKPGTDLVWISAITRYILDDGLAHTSFLEKWVNGLEEYKKSLGPFTMEFAAETCGLSLEMLKQVARMITEAEGVCVLWAMGVTQHSMVADTSTAISNLLLVSGTASGA